MRNLGYVASGFGDLFHLNYQYKSFPFSTSLFCRDFILVTKPPCSWLDAFIFLVDTSKSTTFSSVSLSFLVVSYISTWSRESTEQFFYQFSTLLDFFYYYYLIYFFYILLVVRNLFFLSSSWKTENVFDFKISIMRLHILFKSRDTKLHIVVSILHLILVVEFAVLWCLLYFERWPRWKDPMGS